jgi:DNA-binding NarL/FixJ family response regulator
MPLTILVVDDDPGTCLAVGDYLQMQGYCVVMAEDGQQALELLDVHHPHLVVADIAMPNMDGYELIRRLRTRPNLRLLPVVFLTAHGESPNRILGYQLGCDAYLPKPFELAELGAIVKNLLDRTQLVALELQFARSSVGPVLSVVSSQAGMTPIAADPCIPLSPAALGFVLSQREKEVLQLLSDGLSNAQIGHQLHLSPRTVEKHVSSLLRKTDRSNRAELVRFAIDHQLA